MVLSLAILDLVMLTMLANLIKVAILMLVAMVAHMDTLSQAEFVILVN
jgi:hypothetical protein